LSSLIPVATFSLHYHLSLFLSVFFFYSDGYHRDLLSFPTRRSSDLTSGVGTMPSGSVTRRAALSASLPTERTRAGAWRGSSMRPDRKSTRLNSSHVKISYAVFCLKKKKKKNRMHHRMTDSNRYTPHE